MIKATFNGECAVLDFEPGYVYKGQVVDFTDDQWAALEADFRALFHTSSYHVQSPDGSWWDTEGVQVDNTGVMLATIVSVPAPEALEATPGDTTVDLAWSGVVADITQEGWSYRVLAWTADAMLDNTDTTDTSATFTELENDTEYSFAVVVIDGEGTERSERSDTVTATPVAAEAP